MYIGCSYKYYMEDNFESLGSAFNYIDRENKIAISGRNNSELK